MYSDGGQHETEANHESIKDSNCRDKHIARSHGTNQCIQKPLSRYGSVTGFDLPPCLYRSRNLVLDHCLHFPDLILWMFGGNFSKNKLLEFLSFIGNRIFKRIKQELGGGVLYSSPPGLATSAQNFFCCYSTSLF